MRARQQNVVEPVERVVVVAVLGCPGGRRRDSLYRSLSSCSDEAIDDAIRCLEVAGVVTTTARTVRASPALTLLDGLRLIGV
jgi:hypothetical protein